jgi:hypothetical protein
MSPIEKSRYVAEFLPCKDFAGKDLIAFIVKRTYEYDPFSGQLTPLDEQPPVLLADEPHDDGETDAPSVRFESEFVPPFRPKADVIVLGKAYAPGGEPVPEFFCGVRIGPYEKRLRIIGPRRCTFVPPRKQPKIDKKTGLPKEEVILPPPLISEPEPVSVVELRMKNAYGGLSYLVPSDPEKFEAALEEAKQRDEDAKKKKEEKAKQKAEEEARAAKAAAAAPDQFFSGDADAARGGDGALLLDPDAPLDETAEEELPEVDLSGWGKVGTAGERPRDAGDGATKALDLEEIKATAAEDAYRKSLMGDGDGDGPSWEVDAGDPGVEGGTRILKVGHMVETEDPDWATREREKLSDADRARREAAEKARKEREAAAALPWPRIMCPQNPVGKGFALGNLVETVDGLELPLIEDPDRPIVPAAIPRDVAKLLDEAEAIMPAGLGWFPTSWWPRAMRSGVMPHELEATEAIVDDYVIGLDPEDDEQRAIAEGAIDFKVPVMKPAYYSAAPGGMQVDALVGDEEVMLENLDEGGRTVFRLPGDYPFVTLDRGSGREPVRVRLETVVIDREEARVSMVWRGALPYGGIAEFETYLRFDIDVNESDVRSYREERARRSWRRATREGATRVVDTCADSRRTGWPRKRTARTSMARGRAAAMRRPAKHTPAVVEGGTRMLNLADVRARRRSSATTAFADWIDGAKTGRDAVARRSGASASRRKRRCASGSKR